MMVSSESHDGAEIQPFIHSPSPAHTFVYTRAFRVGGANARVAGLGGFDFFRSIAARGRDREPQPKREVDR